MLDLMAKSVLYVGACGSTIWEASAAGLGIIAAKTFDNQAVNYAALKQRGITVFNRFDAASMAEAAAAWLTACQPNPLSQEIDGDGARRIALVLSECLPLPGTLS